MNCQEVTELMQRYLDKDLNETEYSIVLRHIQQCPECTDMFERLQRLSNDLESLPKVTPPYSIVDSIMPRLLEIDRVQAQANAEQGKVIPLAAKNDQDKMTGDAQRKSMLGRHISWRWVSGVVAAGVILGVFLFQQQPSLRENADEAIPQQFANRIMNQEASASADHMMSSNSMSINEQSGDALSMSEGGSDSLSIPGESGEALSSEKSQLNPSHMQSSPPNGEQVNGQESAKQQSNRDLSSDQREMPPTTIEPSSRSLPENSPNSDVKRNGSDDAFTVAEYQIATTDRTAPDDSQIFELSSPDHMYVAFILGNEIEIRETESGKVIYRSEHPRSAEDKVTLKEWVDHFLVFEVINESEVQQVAIDLNALKSVKADKKEAN